MAGGGATPTGDTTVLGIPVLLFTGPGWPGGSSREPDGPAATAAWLAGTVTTAQFAAEVAAAVDADIRAGVLPPGVSSVGDLHGHVYANEYALEVLGLDLSADGMRLWDEVMTAVDVCLGARPSREAGPENGPAARSRGERAGRSGPVPLRARSGRAGPSAGPRRGPR
jgi:hypothetical protein